MRNIHAAGPGLALALLLAAAGCGAEGYMADQVLTGSTGGGSSPASPAPAKPGDGSSGGSTSPAPASDGSGMASTDPASTGSGNMTPNPGSGADPTNPTPTPAPAMCSTTKDTYANFVEKVFAAECNSCHSTSYSSLANIEDSKAAIRREISNGSMPRAGFKASDTKQRMITWLDCPMLL